MKQWVDGVKAPNLKDFKLMLFNFLEFLGLEYKNKPKKVVINDMETQETEIIDSEQTYKIETKEIKKSDKETIRQTIEIKPIGNGKALRVVTNQMIGR